MILAVAPALPLHTAGKYVAAAYIVFVVVLLIYLGIMALRTGRTNRQLEELRREVGERRTREQPAAEGSQPHTTTEPEREPAL